MSETNPGRSGEREKALLPLRVTDPERVAFHMAEYHALKAEVADLLKQAATFLTFAITISGATMAWLFNSTMSADALHWARWLPFVASALLGCLALAYLVRTGDKAEYLRTIERRLSAERLGWDRQKRRRPWMIIATHLMLWGALNLGGFIVAWNLPELQRSQPSQSPPR